MKKYPEFMGWTMGLPKNVYIFLYRKKLIPEPFHKTSDDGIFFHYFESPIEYHFHWWLEHSFFYRMYKAFFDTTYIVKFVRDNYQLKKTCRLLREELSNYKKS